MSLWSRITGQDAIRAQLDELRAANRELTEMRSIDTLPWSVGSDTLPARAASPSRVMGMPAVYAAIRLIGEAVSTMPVRAYRETATGGKVRIPLPQLIRSPGIHGDITQFLSQVMYALLVHGNAFLLVLNRDGYGYPTTCQVLKDEECYVEDMNQFGRGSYQDPIFRWRGREIDIDQIIHLKWLSQPERIRGITPLSVLAAPTDIGLESNKYAVDWFKGGGIPPGTFANSDMKLSQPEAEQVKAGLVTSIRQHAPIVYGKGWDYKPIQIAPHEAEFVNSLKMSANQVAAIYGIYPSEYLAGESKNNQTYANVVAEMLQFQQFTLRPWLEKI
jgi:HK97 family phage portal protein